MPDSPRPNILFIVADDTTPAYHSCYGGRTPTPNIDAIAAEGALFQRSHAVTALCNPSRFTIFTGLFPGHDPSVYEQVAPEEPYCVMQNTQIFPEMVTIARLLQHSGYYTGHVGKWHSNFKTEMTGAELLPRPDVEDWNDPELQRVLKHNDAVVREVVAKCGGFDFVAASQWGNLGGKKPNRHNVPWQTDAALDFLDQAAERGGSFYLHVANSVPHSPDCSQSLDQDDRYTQAGLMEEPPRSHPKDATVWERMKQHDIPLEGPMAGINAGMLMLDDQVGEILQKLKATGLDQNTIVIYTADHGIAGKGTCHYCGVHMPLVMKWPGQIEPGKVISEPVSHVDFLPTLLEAANIDLPQYPAYDGISFLPVVTGRADRLSREAVYVEQGWGRSVIKGRYQYIAFRYPQSAMDEMQTGKTEVAIDQVGRYHASFGDIGFRFRDCYYDADQLYDLEKDPLQRRNLASDPGHQTTLADLKQELAGYLETFERPFPKKPDPFVQSETFQALVRNRREGLRPVSFYPPETDIDRLYWWNLPLDACQ